MPETLQDKLKSVGLDAAAQLPDESTYTSCCGFHFDKNAPAVINRKIVISIVMWLEKLAHETNDFSILSAALFLADGFIQVHRDSLGEKTLFEELETLIKDFDVTSDHDNLMALKRFSEQAHHIHLPNLIREYLSCYPEPMPNPTPPKAHHKCSLM